MAIPVSGIPLTLKKTEIVEIIKAYFVSRRYAFLDGDWLELTAYDVDGDGIWRLFANAEATAPNRKIVPLFAEHKDIEELIANYLTRLGYTFNSTFHVLHGQLEPGGDADDINVDVKVLAKSHFAPLSSLPGSSCAYKD